MGFNEEEYRKRVSPEQASSEQDKRLHSLAKIIAEKANECCYRSDGYERDIYDLVYKCLEEAYEIGYGDG